MTKKFIPAISVIIPLYNAEKFVGECLESLLQQSFQDFEIIVVDDCSTDNSVKVVESYQKFFGDKLKIFSTKKNSGSPGTPSNLGVKFSRGEYIFFMDNDDAITKTALEELYLLAKNFSADVVNCEKYFYVQTEQNLLGRNDYKITWYNSQDFVDAPTLLSENFAKTHNIELDGVIQDANNRSLTVVGIFEDFPRSCDLYGLQMFMAAPLRTWDGNWQFTYFYKLKEAWMKDAFLESLYPKFKSIYGEKYESMSLEEFRSNPLCQLQLTALKDIHFSETVSETKTADATTTYTLLAIGIVIIIINSLMLNTRSSDGCTVF